MLYALSIFFLFFLLLFSFFFFFLFFLLFISVIIFFFFFFFQAEDGIRDVAVTGVQTCALPISPNTGAKAAFRIALQRLPSAASLKKLTRSSLSRSVSGPSSGIGKGCAGATRSEEHTSELQSRLHLVCRLLLEKKIQILHVLTAG